MTLTPIVVNMMKDKNIQQALGERIKSIRTKKGLSQQKLAELSDLSYKYIGEVERAQQNPTILTLHKIATGLEVPLSELIHIEKFEISRQEAEQEIQRLIQDALKTMPDEDLPRLLALLRLVLPGK